MVKIERKLPPVFFIALADLVLGGLLRFILSWPGLVCTSESLAIEGADLRLSVRPSIHFVPISQQRRPLQHFRSAGSEQ